MAGTGLGRTSKNGRISDLLESGPKSSATLVTGPFEQLHINAGPDQNKLLDNTQNKKSSDVVI